MAIPRLLSIELTYGCHNGRFEFPARTDGPIVILGHNGAGKTTLMEALVLTLYGMDLRREQHRLQARLPWQTDICVATLTLSDEKGEAISVERNFLSQHVVVRSVADGREVFKGDATPGANNADASQYRRFLASRIGLEEREQYENTACVNQGELIQTRLGQHLLLVAAGGHRDVATAKAEIEDSYYELTQEPLIEGDRRRMRGRQLEDIEQEIAQIETRLADARAMQARAEPILREQQQRRADHALVSDEVERLENALPGLMARRTLKAERDAQSERIARVEVMQRELDSALVGFESAQQARALVSDAAAYPGDFKERLAVLEELWPRRAAASRELALQESDLAAIQVPSHAAITIVAILAVLAAAGLFAVGLTLLAGSALAIGVLAAFMFAFWRRQVTGQWQAAIAAVESSARLLNEIESKINARTAGLSDAATLGPETAVDRRQRFDMEQKARFAHEEASRRLSDSLARVDAELQEAGLASQAPAAGQGDVAAGDTTLVNVPAPGPDLAALATAARQKAQHIAKTLSRERHTLAAKDLDLRRALSGVLALPADVPAEADAVEAALRDRAARRQQIEERQRVLDLDLRDYARATENPLALESELALARQRWAEIARKVDVCRRAHALVRDAYEEFHTRDQERLISCISNHLTTMTNGVLGPLDAPETLESVRVVSGDRALELESPPLSYGEFHATLLAVRLGAADFLARTGVRPPFLVDEPFTHLDEERAASVWMLLCSIAKDRQVIVATQDRLMLDALKIRPDITLVRNRAVRPAAATTASPRVVAR